MGRRVEKVLAGDVAAGLSIAGQMRPVWKSPTIGRHLWEFSHRRTIRPEVL